LSANPDPLCQVTGTVNNHNVYAPTFFGYLMAASAANQMQAALTAVMFNFYVGYRATLPWPNPIPASNAVAVHSKGVYPIEAVVVTQALIGSWTA
jgi:hypothetical protein